METFHKSWDVKRSNTGQLGTDFVADLLSNHGGRLPLIGPVTLGKLLALSLPQFPSLSWE